MNAVAPKKSLCTCALVWWFAAIASAGPNTLPAAPKGFDVPHPGAPAGKLVELKYPSNATGKLRPA